MAQQMGQTQQTSCKCQYTFELLDESFCKSNLVETMTKTLRGAQINFIIKIHVLYLKLKH